MKSISASSKATAKPIWAHKIKVIVQYYVPS